MDDANGDPALLFVASDRISRLRLRAARPTIPDKGAVLTGDVDLVVRAARRRRARTT